LLKNLFTPAEVLPAARTFDDATRLVNYFAEGAVTRVNNALYDRLDAGAVPRRLRYGLATNCRCLGCHAWQIVEVGLDGKETVVDETEDLMDWLHEQA
jgi:hypothetical protein